MLKELRGSKIEKRSDNEGNDTLGKQYYNIIIDTYIDAYLLMHKHYLLMCIFSRLRTIHIIIIIYVTEYQKMVPNHTFLFHYIYYCNMNSITFSTLFLIITWNLMLKLSKLCNKYSGNTYA